MTMLNRCHITLCGMLLLVVAAPSPAEPLHFYHGHNRVSLHVSLTELDLVLAPDALAINSAPAQSLQGTSPSFGPVRTGRGGERIVSMQCAAQESIRDLETLARALCREDARIDRARFVAYRSHDQMVDRDPHGRVVLTRRIVAHMGAEDDPERLASSAGVHLVERVPIGEGLYLFEAEDGLEALRVANHWAETGRAAAAQPLVEHEMFVRLIPDDPLFPNQWNLENTGQGGGTTGVDLNIVSPWDQYRGAGANIAIVDDAVQVSHPDLSPNHDPTLSYDYCGEDMDPAPTCFQTHGTSVAGVAVARGLNALGVTGVAPEATLAGIRLLSCTLTDTRIGLALSHRADVMDIYNNSWGPSDNGSTLLGPGVSAQSALEEGVLDGRSGKGAIFVWAAGNGLTNGDNANYDGYANSRMTIAVTGTDNTGVQPYYAEPGACIHVNVPSSGGSLSVTTTDLVGSCGASTDDYRDSFGMTSAAAPQVAGVVALLLEANPNLSWRDVQHVLVTTAVKNDPGDSGWSVNGAGHDFNHAYGFGRVDASAASQAALSWSPVGEEVSAEVTVAGPVAVPDNDPVGVSMAFEMPADIVVETVEIPVDISTARRGDLQVELESPDGTVSVLAEQHGDSNSDYVWTFTSVQHWNEHSAGTWTLRVKDLQSANPATVNGATLRVWGTAGCPDLFGDFDYDCAVDLNDFLTFTSCLAGSGSGTSSPGCSATDFAHADADGDADVDLGDFLIFAANFSG